MAKRKAAPFSNSLSRIASRPEQAEALLQAGLGSALSIARASVETLMKQVPGLSGTSAQRLHQRASALAVLAARHYREQRLTASEVADQPWLTGLRALVDGPTFDSQFSPNWNDNCPPGSIEATTSPAAYLTALFQWATQVIEPLANVEEGKPIFLAERRPDLAGLILDNHSLERVEPTVGIVNEILEGAARKHLDDHNLKDRSVDDALLEARYPFGLPFERYMSQINRILQPKGYGLGDLVRQLDPAFPYFCRDGLHSLRSDDALQMDTALGPEQRALLLEAPYFPRGARRASARSVQTLTNPRSLLREPLHTLQAGFFMRHYGVAKAEDLLPLSAFCLRTGLDQDGVESLLSIQRHAPVASANVPGLATPTPAQFGSTYINAGLEPTLGVTSTAGSHALSDWSNDHFDRMQRLARLARWLELPFGETDLLLDAALQAEYGDAGRGREISENTLRALGLFRRLRRDFKIGAEDFAALLRGVALYARGSEIPQFDRVFNDPTLFSEPLVLDGSPFNIVPGNESEYRKINHLCAALGLDHETYLYLARLIVQAWSVEQARDTWQGDILHWSHGVVSAFYRLARLPAWLGLSSIEALGLLQLIGERGHQYVSRLVRTSLEIHQHSDLSDTLSVIQSLTDAVHWCREHELSVSWLYQHLMPLAPVAAASDRELDLLRQINGRMLPSLLSEAVFREAGIPMVSGVDLPTPIDWLKQLDTFVSGQGLILEQGDYSSDETYEAALQQRLEAIVDDLELPDGPHVLVRVFQLVMDARSAQRSLVWESLASTFGGSAELNQEVLAWAGGSSYQLLGEVLRLFNGATEPLPIPIGDEVLALFARLAHRMGIVEQLSISPLGLRSWRLHREWFEGHGGEAGAEVTFADLHLLTRYRYLLAFTRQAEQAVLDYLKLVNNLPEDLTEHDLQLIREDAAGKVAVFTGFGIRDILETALEITPRGFIASLRELDHLVRVRQICTTLDLGSDAALGLSRLRSNSALLDYRAAAENALGSLGQREVSGGVPAQGELGQSEASWITVDTLRLVAKSTDKARCLLTVKNFFGQPMADVTVRWETSLSRLDAPSSDSTDANGQVWVELQAGEDMGSAQVTARFGLDRQVLAPLIQIDCDIDSLYIRDPVRTPDEALAGNLQAIDFRLQVLDEPGNYGRDQVVHWSTDLGTFERPQTRTDAEGFAAARLLSRSSGVATVIARLPINGEEEAFDPVTFLEQQYFQYVRFTGPVAAGQRTSAVCRVVNLDGSPQRQVTVLWLADFGGFIEDPASSITDDDGIATIQYLSNEAGAVTLTVNADFDNKPLQPLSSARTTVHEMPALVEMEPAQQYYSLRQAKPATFHVRLEPAAAGYPVTWWAGEQLLATTYTSADGGAGYHLHFSAEQLGDQLITVRGLRDDDRFDFTVQVVEPHVRLAAQAGPDSPGIDLAEEARWVFAVDPGLSSDLLVFAERVDGVGDDSAWLSISLGSYANPAALGVVFDFPLDEPIHCDADGKITLGFDCTGAAFHANSDPHNNHIRLLVTSNLGVTMGIWVGLRYLLALEKSPLHFFRGTLDDVGRAALSGRVSRKNGNGRLQLRADARRLRLTLDGAASPVETDLFQYDSDGLWLHAPLFSGASGELGASCSFVAVGDLSKRVHFVGSDTFQAKRIIGQATLDVKPIEDPGLIEEGTTIFVDHGDRYGLVLTLSDADGPIEGLPLLSQARVNGAQYLAIGPSDAGGHVHVEVDTADAVAGPHALPMDLAHLSWTLDVNVRELVSVTVLEMERIGTRIVAALQLSRREGRLFIPNRLWMLEASTGSDSEALIRYPEPEALRGDVDLFHSYPQPLVVRLILNTVLEGKLIGPTEFPIPAADSLSVGDKP